MAETDRKAAFATARAWLTQAGDHIINGESVGSPTRLPVHNPADETEIGSIAAGGPAEVDAAVAAASACFQSDIWRAMTPAVREGCLLRLADLIEADADTIAAIETLDNGAPFAATQTMVGKAAPSSIRYNAGWARRMGGETVEPSVPGRFHAYTVQEPVGIAGLIVPWNAPFIIACNKVSAALAAGCTVVLKPAELAPMTCLKLVELVHKAGFPNGAVNVVNGLGAQAGAALAAHPDVAKISFTGSTMTGKAIMRQAADRVARISLELGGKSPVIVFDDADLERAIPAVAMGIFANSGQVCAAGSRLFVQSGIYDKFLDGLAKFASGLRLGSGEEEGHHLGPIISAAQKAKVEGYIASALSEGARLVFQGDCPQGQGHFVAPTILDQCTPNMRAVREEIFGPVLCVMRFDDDADLASIAVQANDSDYGLSSYAWTRDIERAHGIARLLRAGSVKVNGAGMEFALPFGGFGQSGLGRENGRAGVLSFTETKSVMIGF